MLDRDRKTESVGHWVVCCRQMSMRLMLALIGYSVFCIVVSK